MCSPEDKILIRAVRVWAFTFVASVVVCLGGLQACSATCPVLNVVADVAKSSCPVVVEYVGEDGVTHKLSIDRRDMVAMVNAQAKMLGMPGVQGPAPLDSIMASASASADAVPVVVASASASPSVAAHVPAMASTSASAALAPPAPSVVASGTPSGLVHGPAPAASPKPAPKSSAKSTKP